MNYKSIGFMTFWYSINKILQANGKDELGWHDARAYWFEIIERQNDDNFKAEIEKLRRAA